MNKKKKKTHYRDNPNIKYQNRINIVSFNNKMGSYEKCLAIALIRSTLLAIANNNESINVRLLTIKSTSSFTYIVQILPCHLFLFFIFQQSNSFVIST